MNYLHLAANESAHAATLETKALSRNYNICIIVIPRDPRLGTLTFKAAWKAKALVLWYTPKQIDLILPDSDSEAYPEGLFSPMQSWTGR